MLKTSLLFLLLSCWITAAFSQQHAHRDSMIRAARADAKSFRLDSVLWKKYRHKLPSTSDYFKPRAAVVKNAALLSDSVYVDKYRREAYRANKRRRTPWHYVLVAGGTAAGLYVLLITAVLIAIAGDMG